MKLTKELCEQMSTEDLLARITDPDILKKAKRAMFLGGISWYYMKHVNPHKKEVEMIYTELQKRGVTQIPDSPLLAHAQKTKKRTWILLIILLAVLLIFAISDSSGSSKSSKPWKELGVSEKEYKEVYNYYKYGTWG